MSPFDSKIRLGLYVACAMVAAASAGLIGTDFSNAKEVAGYVLGVIGTGLITARSYIDKSPSEVITDKPKDP